MLIVTWNHFEKYFMKIKINFISSMLFFLHHQMIFIDVSQFKIMLLCTCIILSHPFKKSKNFLWLRRISKILYHLTESICRKFHVYICSLIQSSIFTGVCILLIFWIEILTEVFKFIIVLRVYHVLEGRVKILNELRDFIWSCQVCQMFCKVSRICI